MNKIRLLVMDVDGTLNDGKIYIGKHGELFKTFDIKDGLGIADILPKLNIEPIIITGRNSAILEQRCSELKIKEYYQGIKDKVKILNDLLQKYNIGFEQVAYIGDDINDLDCMKLCAFKACPADAVKEIQSACDYVCKKAGGSGAVREFIDWIKLNNY